MYNLARAIRHRSLSGHGGRQAKSADEIGNKKMLCKLQLVRMHDSLTSLVCLIIGRSGKPRGVICCIPVQEIFVNGK